MRPTNPIENTGVVLGIDSAFLGSCFVFRYPHFVLTAKHTVSDHPPQQLTVSFPSSRSAERYSVARIVPHPEADIAVLELNGVREEDVTYPQGSIFDDHGLGLPIASYGYPEEYLGGADQPTPRFFKGYVQRFFDLKSNAYRYHGVELSFPCPKGLSGAAVFHPEHIGRLYRVITGELETTTDRTVIVHVKEGEKEYKEVSESLIRYGLALWLPTVEDWLNEIVSPVSHEELVRRGEAQQTWLESQSG